MSLPMHKYRTETIDTVLKTWNRNKHVQRTFLKSAKRKATSKNPLCWLATAALCRLLSSLRQHKTEEIELAQRWPAVCCQKCVHCI